ncbi:MAG: nitrite/sulfite reductase [candidate division Zixibacteria bacterium]|nr:nitrite/sulfite reductase [candidate division Zixibacteria bacterium]
MKASNTRWRDRLEGDIPDGLANEIYIFETEIALRKQGKIDEKVFAETRLRRGVYGQRYDNGQRHDGLRKRKLAYPAEGLLKGPDTLWDAPGMQRIKIPFGGMNSRQLEVMAELAEEYSEGIAHVTTRQDFQLHFVHIDDTPSLMRRLAAVGITTREACGNSVRNVTACPLSGVCHDETFDVTPYAKGLAQFLLGHPDAQDFGRKVKIAFSGCAHNACGLTAMHDMGGIAVVREINGQQKRGFRFYVGGGLGAVPYQAKLFDEFLPEEELLPISQAISRVFGRLGEKRNRARARIKFLVNKLGIEEFKRLVLEEREKLTPDPAWTSFLSDLHATDETPLRLPAPLEAPRPEGFNAWYATNVYAQKQPGYVVVTVTLPLGDITADQLRGLADIARRFVRDTIRTTVEQNMVLRWVSEGDVGAVYDALKTIGLAQPGAGTIVDVTACPGTDTCKLGIASSRGLAGELRTRLAEKSVRLDATIRNLRIKISGCFNSCGQHHVADIGFYGVSRHVGGYTVPHFQVILGGQWTENAGAYGLAVGAVPSKRIPEVVDRVTSRYLTERAGTESFQDFIKRIGKQSVKEMFDDLAQVPSYETDASFYSDWSDPREFTTGDMGTGECAGEVVTQVEFALAAAEREAFEAQVLLDRHEAQTAGERATAAMLRAAQALVRIRVPEIGNESARIVTEFRAHFYDTQLFFDPFGGGRFAQYLFLAFEHAQAPFTPESAHHRIEEAQLFIEASYACYARMQTAAAPAAGG